MKKLILFIVLLSLLAVSVSSKTLFLQKYSIDCTCSNQIITSPFLNYIQFNTSYIDTTHSTGELYWNDIDGTLNLGMKGNNVLLQIGQEMLIRAKNGESFTIKNGQLVYISGGSGSNAVVSLANSTKYNKSYVIGMATENILSNQFGYVTTEGLVRDLNTNSYPVGTILYLKSNGNFTNIKPYYPSKIIIVGTVVRQHATEGVIYVRIDDLVHSFGTNVSSSNSHFEADGTLVFIGNATVWDDTATSILTSKLSATNPVVWKTWKGNLGSYSFEEKIITLEESLEFTQQLSHKVKIGSQLDCHLHYNVPTASTQNITFYLEYNCANLTQNYYTTNKNKTVTGILQNSAYRQSLLDFDGISCYGSISQIEKFYLKRLSSKDSYTNDVFVDYFDCHYEIDTVGSRTEFIK